MNYQESRDYIDKITREIPSVLGLDHMRELMKRLGNPQEKALLLPFYILRCLKQAIVSEGMFHQLCILTEAGWKSRAAESAEKVLQNISHRWQMPSQP